MGVAISHVITLETMRPFEHVLPTFNRLTARRCESRLRNRLQRPCGRSHDLLTVRIVVGARHVVRLVHRIEDLDRLSVGPGSFDAG